MLHISISSGYSRYYTLIATASFLLVALSDRPLHTPSLQLYRSSLLPPKPSGSPLQMSRTPLQMSKSIVGSCVYTAGIENASGGRPNEHMCRRTLAVNVATLRFFYQPGDRPATEVGGVASRKFTCTPPMVIHISLLWRKPFNFFSVPRIIVVQRRQITRPVTQSQSPILELHYQ